MTKLALAVRGTSGGLLLAILLATGSMTLLLPAPAQAAQQVSAAVFEKLKPAQEALQKRDYGSALRLAKEAHGVAKAGFEKEIALKIQLQAAFGVKQYNEAIDAIEALSALDGVSGAEKNQFRRMLPSLYESTRQYDKALASAQELIRSGGGGAKEYEVLYRIYATRGDCPNALNALDKALGGKPADETQLKLRNQCYDKAKDAAKQTAVVEELVRRFPKKVYFSILLGLYADLKLDDRAALNVYRWGFDKDLLEREIDFTSYASLAQGAGSAAEAERVLEKGVKAGVVKKGDAASKTARLIASSTSLAAEEKNKLPQLDKEARAGKNGESDVTVGASYFGFGEYAKAAEALQRAFQPDRAARIKRPDDANMLLGITLTKINKKADAEKAFTAAKADPRMAKPAALWLGR